MSQPDQNPTPQVTKGPRKGPQKEDGKGPHISTAPVIEPTGGKGPHITITAKTLKPSDSIVSSSLQTPAVPSSEEPDGGDPTLDGGKGPH